MSPPSSGAQEILILVESIHAVLRCERELKARGIACDLIPVPRELRSDCGMCLALAPAEFARAAAALRGLRRQGRDGPADPGFAAFRRTPSGFLPALAEETGAGG